MERQLFFTGQPESRLAELGRIGSRRLRRTEERELDRCNAGGFEREIVGCDIADR